ncbi:hypothetical protein [Micromonospora eburnea]|uniref:hypothetical protein n=1 Tax=Micromonospora eburnea TaxID=227316 RepID=UPI00114CF6C4|nr:hypothetical protein [Micromonospora eburnea]
MLLLVIDGTLTVVVADGPCRPVLIAGISSAATAAGVRVCVAAHRDAEEIWSSAAAVFTDAGKVNGEWWRTRRAPVPMKRHGGWRL